MAVPLRFVDAFADRPFTGNPAAVCLLAEPGDPGWMQRVAAEMNQAETAFVAPRSDGGFDLRWFTPTREVDLCGHATLASAHLLWEDGALAADAPARFATRGGWLTCRRAGDAITMDFPAHPPRGATPPVDDLADRLGARLLWVGTDGADWLVELDDAATVRDLAPDLRRLGEIDARAIIVTAASDDRVHDFVSRCFAPAVGIDEDPVTGSAHCVLGPFWGRRLGKAEMLGWQASRRGGAVGVGLRGERVELRGRAVTVLRGDLLAG
jgi:PhzF family phenazine biosynthesis protein